ncbi:MAG: cyclic nucleotide-binding domain-containing protein, partial [Planctomycetota bacterium]
MAEPTTGIARPSRWGVPFGPDMTDDDVDRILSVPPFCDIDPGLFREPRSLRGIIRNDCRLARWKPGEIIIREGDYGNSLFYVMSGEVRVAIESLPRHLLGRPEAKRHGVFGSIAQLWRSAQTVERRDPSRYGKE